MAGAYPHLSFSKETPLTPRRSRPGFGTKVQRGNPVEHVKNLKKQVETFRKVISDQVGGSTSRNLIQIKLNERMSFEEITKHGISIVSQEDQTVYIAFADEKQLQQFNERLSLLVDGEYVTYANLLFAIDKIDAWGYEDRKSWALQQFGFPDEDTFRLDVELWPLGSTGSIARNALVSDFLNWLSSEDIQHLDKVNRDSLVMFRVTVNLNQAQYLLQHRDVRQVDLPPKTGVDFAQLNLDVNILPPTLNTVAESASKICVLDSGINANHILLQGAVGDAQSFVDREDEFDYVGHGTAVAGVALFGDLEARIDGNDWTRDLWLLSGKVLATGSNGQTEFDTKTIESTLSEAISYFYREYGCRIYNLSLGNENAPYLHNHVSGIAVTLDELARELDILIVVSAGNYSGSERISNWRDDYPHFLLSDDAALIDPAPAVNVLTVGAMAKHTSTYTERYYQRQGEINELHVANEGQVSPFSRSSQSDKSVLKPDFLAHGGNFAIPARLEGKSWKQVFKHLGVVTLNHNPQGNTLLSEYSGTSFSAPYITNLAGRLLNSYPDSSANLLRALLANHARITPELGATFSDKKDVRRVAGYGVIDEDSLFRSSEEHVVLISEEQIENDTHQFFELPIPEDYFRKGKATRTITVSLAYSPSVRTTRLEYIATKIKYHLVHGDSLEAVSKSFNNENKKTTQSIPECDGTKRDLTQDDRSRGTLQSSTWTYSQFNKPRKLFLVVTRQDTPWASNQVKEKEDYALAISITDRENEEARLYQQVSEKLQARERLRARAKLA
ncbi:S8 family peptidase [Vibrio parahaemolyticus]|uniref:S8 family peptidase n=1 Tax=Vibrio parahaemolyticus TaxID=670 RepID=A0AA47JMS6_VIBPH|nr:MULTISPECIES: S8 family peptidase [Vibrio]AYO05887.1 S8 family peptidase [Vibrio parahaemolyticus]EJG0622688.1 S8 family peptidase [Vibrio parahaemolyticus]EJG0640832.1 S8 family peptidase [Vibrio parahaemolyticus]EJG0687702.1 S8 family peptidase [Vibrio parahaemolyticus]EJG0702207.1 S8 family peptidase [Vibrio parahaemolyticus]